MINKNNVACTTVIFNFFYKLALFVVSQYVCLALKTKINWEQRKKISQGRNSGWKTKVNYENIFNLLISLM